MLRTPIFGIAAVAMLPRNDVCNRRIYFQGFIGENMSKIFKCFVCGLLGIVIGAGATFGAMAAAVYYSYGNVTVSSVIGVFFIISSGYWLL